MIWRVDILNLQLNGTGGKMEQTRTRFCRAQLAHIGGNVQKVMSMRQEYCCQKFPLGDLLAAVFLQPAKRKQKGSSFFAFSSEAARFLFETGKNIIINWANYSKHSRNMFGKIHLEVEEERGER